MTDAPNIPDDNGGLASDGKLSSEDAAASEQRQGWLRADTTGSTLQAGSYGDLKQNLTNHWKVQER